MDSVHGSFGISVTRDDGGAIIVAPAGEVALESVAVFRQAVADAARSVPPATALVVDLHAVTFMDSSGIGALVMGRRFADAAGIPYMVYNADPTLYRRIIMMGILTVLNYATRHGEPEDGSSPSDPEGSVVT